MIEDMIIGIINDRTDLGGSSEIWKDIYEEKNGETIYKGELSIEDEIEAKCKEKGIDVSVERWETFENPSIAIFGLSVAWIENGELHHYVDTLRLL